MPTYEYQCSACRHRFEKFQSFSEEPVRVCPVCGQSVKKVISSAGIIFKGSGWYINDSKAKTNAAKPAAASKEDAPATAGAENSAGAEAGEAKKEPAAPVAGDNKGKNESESRPKEQPATKKEPAAKKESAA